MSDVSAALALRNAAWNSHPAIPRWVSVSSVGLDQFFTRPEIAQKCWRAMQNYLAEHGALLGTTFLEPSAGHGAFFDLMPATRRIGVDVVAHRHDFCVADFLSWLPPADASRPIACVGNPPFGYRAWLALAFINHALKFSEVVGFILPMAFQSRGKGNPQDRVVGGRLVHSTPLPPDSFLDEAGKPVRVNCLWQIWERCEVAKSHAPVATCNRFLDLFTVDQRRERLCGIARMAEADFFLQRTFYTEPPQLVTRFDQVKYVCGYGIVLKESRADVEALLKRTDWCKYSNLASHNCRHISMGHIRAALIDAGFSDQK